MMDSNPTPFVDRRGRRPRLPSWPRDAAGDLNGKSSRDDARGDLRAESPAGSKPRVQAWPASA